MHNLYAKIHIWIILLWILILLFFNQLSSFANINKMRQWFSLFSSMPDTHKNTDEGKSTIWPKFYICSYFNRSQWRATLFLIMSKSLLTQQRCNIDFYSGSFLWIFLILLAFEYTRKTNIDKNMNYWIRFTLRCHAGHLMRRNNRLPSQTLLVFLTRSSPMAAICLYRYFQPNGL